MRSAPATVAKVCELARFSTKPPACCCGRLKYGEACSPPPPLSPPLLLFMNLLMDALGRISAGPEVLVLLATLLAVALMGVTC